MIWLDGLSSRYVTREGMPFVFELARSGLATTLEPLFAFAGIGVSTFTGTPISTHGIWCDFVLRESRRLPPLFKWWLRLCDLLPHDLMNQYARYLVGRIFRLNPGTPNLIPVELVDFFEVREGRRLTDEEPLPGVVTLFDQLRRHGAKLLVLGFYESLGERQLITRARRALGEDYRFILVRLASLDRLGHRYGPESGEVARRLGEIDQMVQALVEASPRGVHFVFYSDHGMSPVRGHVDLMGLLGRLAGRVPQDYVFFLNSTVANFWFSTGAARKRVAEELGRIEPGIILDGAKLEKLGLSRIGAEYGELLFALKEGYVFFPDFFRRRQPPKGMHGYAFPSYDKPPFILYTPGVSYGSPPSPARFIDVMPTILDLLRVPIPPSCQGRSLLPG